MFSCCLPLLPCWSHSWVPRACLVASALVLPATPAFCRSSTVCRRPSRHRALARAHPFARSPVAAYLLFRSRWGCGPPTAPPGPVLGGRLTESCTTSLQHRQLHRSLCGHRVTAGLLRVTSQSPSGPPPRKASTPAAGLTLPILFPSRGCTLPPSSQAHP